MTDKDVVERLVEILKSWDVETNIGITHPTIYGRTLRRDGQPFKTQWRFQVRKANHLKTIIDKTYQYFSEKKQSDCDRVLKNLADRGLL